MLSIEDKIEALGVKWEKEKDSVRKTILLHKRAELIDVVLRRNWEHARMHKSRTGSH